MPVTIRGSGQLIVQVVQASTTTQTNTTSTSYVDTALTANITPTSASNRILVVAYCPYQVSAGNGFFENFGILGLFRGTTVIEEQQVGINVFNNTNSKSSQMAWCPSVLDSPATTSVVNYNVKIRVPNSGFNMQFRVPDVYGAASNNNNNPRLTLMEISG